MTCALFWRLSFNYGLQLGEEKRSIEKNCSQCSLWKQLFHSTKNTRCSVYETKLNRWCFLFLTYFSWVEKLITKLTARLRNSPINLTLIWKNSAYARVRIEFHAIWRNVSFDAIYYVFYLQSLLSPICAMNYVRESEWKCRNSFSRGLHFPGLIG